MASVDDVIDDLARKVKADVIATCAKVALIHAVPSESDDYKRACKDIADRIQQLGQPSKRSAA